MPPSQKINGPHRADPTVGKKPSMNYVKRWQDEMIVLLGVGHSHLAALREAHYDKLRANRAPREYHLEFQHLAHDPFKMEGVGAEEIRPKLKNVFEEIRGAISKARQIAIPNEPKLFFSLMGHYHFFRATTNHPRPYDFVLPERPDLDLDQDAQIIDSRLVEASLKEEIRPCLEFLEIVRAEARAHLFLYSSPPPIGDDEFLSQVRHIGKFSEHGVSPADFRLKTWLLQERIYRQACKSLNVGYVGAAPHTCDAKGFLRREYWHEDGFHGNPKYGEVMLEHVLDAIMNRSGVERVAHDTPL
jgi:hypothetical protein